MSQKKHLVMGKRKERFNISMESDRDTVDSYTTCGVMDQSLKLPSFTFTTGTEPTLASRLLFDNSYQEESVRSLKCDRFVYFRKLPISCDLHWQQSVEFIQDGAENQKTPRERRFCGRRRLVLERDRRTGWFELPGRI